MMRAEIDYITKASIGREVRRPIFLLAAVYDAAKAEAVDMTPYIRQEPIPAAPER